MEQKTPKTIFEQIVFGQEITNENIVTLAINLEVVNKKIDEINIKLDALLGIFNPAQSEPNASGKENM